MGDRMLRLPSHIWPHSIWESNGHTRTLHIFSYSNTFLSEKLIVPCNENYTFLRFEFLGSYLVSLSRIFPVNEGGVGIMYFMVLGINEWNDAWTIVSTLFYFFLSFFMMNLCSGFVKNNGRLLLDELMYKVVRKNQKVNL